MASKWLWCIFQLPLMTGLRGGIGCSSQRGEAGQVALLDELERRAPAGRHVVDFVDEAEAGQRGRTVAAADDGEAATIGDGLGHGPGARGEARVFEHAHGAVPEHRACLGDLVAELGRGAGPDVEALPPGWY